MGIRSRLTALERKAQKAGRRLWPSVDLFERIRQLTAYYAGTGPRPPDRSRPPWIAPAAWESRLRVASCTDLRQAGELADDAYLPGMTEEERRLTDHQCAVLAAVGGMHGDLHPGNNNDGDWIRG